MGKLLAERIHGNEHPLLAALRRRTPRTLQWGTIKAVLGVANLLDERVNRRARSGPAV